MLDNSDGLARSAAIISGLSRCRVIVSVGEAACAPELRAYSARAGRPWRHYAVNGGEDYGLIFTSSGKNLGEIKKRLPGAFVVGRVEKGSGAGIENFNGKIESFEHF